jgi:hypothetical protein
MRIYCRLTLAPPDESTSTLASPSTLTRAPPDADPVTVSEALIDTVAPPDASTVTARNDGDDLVDAMYASPKATLRPRGRDPLTRRRRHAAAAGDRSQPSSRSGPKPLPRR